MSKCQTNSKSFIGCRFINTIDTDSDKVEIYDVIDHAIARAMTIACAIARCFASLVVVFCSLVSFISNNHDFLSYTSI